MLFKQSGNAFSHEMFRNPEACYRGAPFWSWNTCMTKEMLEEQILLFQKMGMGGFHIHVRVGLRNQYMDSEFLELVRFCKEKARENGMLCWLYDEDRYSSGIAGGEVTKRVFFRARWLKLTVKKDPEMLDCPERFREEQGRNQKTKGCFLGAYDVVLRGGFLERASAISPEASAEGRKYYLYLELAQESPWCNNQTYVDTLKEEAIGAFIQTTHERYAEVLQEDFGDTVPAIFTDEPHISGLGIPARSEAAWEIRLPYTEELPGRYREVSGMDFFQALPYLIWSREGEEACLERYYYYETLCQMFTGAYCRQIGHWCEAHGLRSTGHLLSEDSLRGQACAVGEAMRCYREFQIPGIDNLCDNRDFLAAKQVSSIAHQYEKEGVLSELYGVTQWDFDFEGYKLAGDWQAALGINVRVPHLAWASMNGEAKRDYPAAIGWQSPWYEDFSYIEDHFARVNYCLTRGKPVIHVAVLHTVESFWLLQGTGLSLEEQKEQLEEDFQNVTGWLLSGGIDFDYVAESLLAEEKQVRREEIFQCGVMGYQAVVVPSCINLRKTTVEKLLLFAEAGGTVLFTGKVPKYADCRKSGQLEYLVSRCKWIPLSKGALLEELESWREVEFREEGVRPASNLLYQMRQEDHCRWLFIAQAYRGMEGRQNGGIWHRRPLHKPQDLEIRIRGVWTVEKYDTLKGEVEELQPVYQGEKTVLYYDLYGDDSLLLRLTPASRENAKADRNGLEQRRSRESGPAGQQRKERRYSLPEPVEYRMSEPNALLLDVFSYSLDGEPYGEACEILKLDNRLRERLKLPLRCEALAQPYIRITEEVRDHTLRLRTNIYSMTELEDCCLALEEAEHCICRLNGCEAEGRPVGYYVDPAITVIRLPKLLKGKNELCLEIEYGDCTNLEWMYLLGDFGVGLEGAHAFLYPKPERLFWGDYTRQGFPFYTGNMTYVTELPKECLEEEGTDKVLQVPYYSGAAVKASVHGKEEQMMAFLPYTCRLDGLEETGRITITCLGNRYNGFGQLHLIGDDLVWLGQNSWRTQGTSWTDTYQVRPMGILTAPQVIAIAH